MPADTRHALEYVQSLTSKGENPQERQAIALELIAASLECIRQEMVGSTQMWGAWQRSNAQVRR